MQNEDELFPSHGEAVANILHSMKGHTWVDGSFEHGILSTLLFLVVRVSLFLSSILYLTAVPDHR